MSSLLQARGITHYYSVGKVVLNDLSLDIGPGELIVIAGRNGAGKTVLAKCLAGLERPRQGQVLFEGVELLGLKGSSVRRVAYLFQDARLQILGDSVLDDLLFGLDALGIPSETALTRATNAILTVGLQGKEDCIPWELSGGEQRRLALGAMIALDPPVLILDEPFANLDWASIASLLEVLIRLKAAGRALIVLTHELEKVLSIATKLIILDKGKKVLEGDPEEVLRSGIEPYGVRDPLKKTETMEDLLWLDRSS